jgi:superfamily I DNA and/or RNA helicase
MEYEYEKQEYQQLCQQVGIQRRIRQGKCWYPVMITRTYYNALDQFCIEMTCPDDILQREVKNQETGELSNKDIEFEFEPGRPVAFFRVAAKDDKEKTVFFPYSCQVSRYDGQRLQVTVPGTQAAQVLCDYAREGMLGVQLSFDATTYRVMREAIHELQNTEDKKLLHLRSVLIGNEQPGFRVEQPISFPWLNDSQQKAVQKVLCAREVAIVHGPPGTGKTTTLVEAIGETLRREAQVMVCAQSNAAVDWISEQLLARGISVLRIGNPMRVSDNLLAATYERRYEAHPDYTELWAIRKAIREAVSRLSGNRLSGSERSSLGNHVSKLRNRATELEIRINEELFASSRVIACTLIGTASRVLERMQFSTLFIDEAAQAFEGACWAAIRHADRVIFAGDHKQLPPTIKCKEAEKAGLSRTLMEVVAQSKPSCVELLTVQYRMHRDIMKFSSDWFYHGRLTAAPECAERTIVPIDPPLIWIDTANLGYEEEQNPLSQSRLNTNEGILLVETLKLYVNQIGKNRLIDERVDFGIISPYKSQVQLLRRLIKNEKELKQLFPYITVNTVDGFQGQERDVILISMVRGNDEGRIGFLGDLRRMNVAITRARMKLIILGDTSTLSKTRFYRKLIEHVTENGRMLVIPGQPKEDKQQA